MPSFSRTVAGAAGASLAALSLVGAATATAADYDVPAYPVPTVSAPAPAAAFPAPAVTAAAAVGDVKEALQDVEAAASPKLRMVLEDTSPGTYSVIIYRHGTKSKLIDGDRLVKGTHVKPAKIVLERRKSAQAYLENAAKTRDAVRVDLRVAFTPAGSTKTTVQKSAISLGL